MERFKCQVDPTKLRTPRTNIMKTQALFAENVGFVSADRGEGEPVYTLKEFDYQGYPSMYKIFISCDTEYEAAIKLLGSYKHWKKLCKAVFFQEYIEEWREERKMMEEALAHTAIIRSTEEGNVSAARSIMAKPATIAGRPTNDIVQGEIKKAVAHHQELDSIVKRMENV